MWLYKIYNLWPYLILQVEDNKENKGLRLFLYKFSGKVAN